jgi:hypothetical protein
LKSVETLAKSLLSKQLPMALQEELATFITTAIGYGTRDDLLI